MASPSIASVRAVPGYAGSRMSVDGSGSLKPRRVANRRTPSRRVLSGPDESQTAMQLLLDSRKLLYLATVVERGA
jgi:hypothetical protein